MKFLSLEQRRKKGTFEEYFDAEWDAFEKYMAEIFLTIWPIVVQKFGRKKYYGLVYGFVEPYAKVINRIFLI